MLPELTIRLARPEDVDEIMSIALMACEENGFVNPNPLKLLYEIWPALNQDHGLIGMIGGFGEPIEGVVLLRIGSVWYGDAPLLEEKAIFVHPDYRAAKGGRAARLCEFSKHVSDELGIPLTIGVLSHERTRGKIKMYTRIMGEPAGAYWLYGAKTGEFGTPV